VARGDFFPVLCGSPQLDIGTRLLADFLIEECPSLDERRDVDGPPSAVVFKTRSDPYVGHISLMRALSGSLRPDDTLANARSGQPVRLNRMFALQGSEQVPVTAVCAGDLVAAAKLDDVRTGDVLMADGASAAPIDLGVPQGYHRAAVATRSAKDEDRLPDALRRLREEDPSLGVEVDEATRQLILVGYGPGHVQTAITRLGRRYGVEIDEVPRRLRYRETITEPAQGRGRHVKQTGGSGQYGIAVIEVEPLPRGTGFEFTDEIVGGVIPRQYIGSVEKGVQLAMERGVLAGYPCVDVRVRLIDGKSHRVDSSQVAFEMAGAAAFRDAAHKAAPVLLEPIMRVEVTVPDAYTGDVMGDLSARRGRIEGTYQIPPARTAVSALVPEAELVTYVGDLRGLTQGQGVITMVHDHHAPLPSHLAPLGSESPSPASPAAH
jgi:elongation factor G